MNAVHAVQISQISLYLPQLHLQYSKDKLATSASMNS